MQSLKLTWFSIFCVFVSLFSVLFMIIYPLLLFYSLDQSVGSVKNADTVPYPSGPMLDEESHVLCVIVPFRDRWSQVTTFVPYMSEFLSNQGLVFYIYIVNQVDRYRFNRGALLNSGTLYAHPSCDYFALHDIDLLPNNPSILYSFPSVTGPTHLSSSKYHPFYNFDTYFGGILLISRKHYLHVNGFSNKFWGWGLEDDEFRLRIIQADLNITIPNFPSDSKSSFLHISESGFRSKSNERDSKDWLDDKRRKRDRLHGRQDLNISGLPKLIDVSVNGYPYVQIDVKFECEVSVTPWCMSEFYM